MIKRLRIPQGKICLSYFIFRKDPGGENKTVKEFTKRYNVRFGQIAVKLGFITMEQLQQGLAEQVEDDIAQKPHRLIGEICLEKGWLTPRQIEIIIDEHLKYKQKSEEKL